MLSGGSGFSKETFVSMRRRGRDAPIAAICLATHNQLGRPHSGHSLYAKYQLLVDSNAEVVLIDRRNHHIFRPLLYQVATAVLAPSEIVIPIRQLVEKQKNLSVIMAEVTRVDLTSRSLDTICPVVGTRKIEAFLQRTGGRLCFW